MKEKRIVHYEDASLTSDDVKRLKDGLAHDLVDVISLRNCNVTDKDYKLILKTLGGSRTVRHLGLSVDQVTDRFRVQVLAKALQKNISLAGLHLHGNPVTDEYLSTLQQPIYRHPRLVCLDLSDCRLGDQGVAILVHILKDTRERHGLQELLLSHNTSITGEGWRRLAMSLAAGSTLHTLYIDHNAIGDVSASCLVTALPGATRLSTLDMECTGITDVTGQVLLNLIKSFKLNLKTIVLKNNNIPKTTKAEIKLKLIESDNHELIEMLTQHDMTASDDSRSLATSEPPLETVTDNEYHDYANMSQLACMPGSDKRSSRPETNVTNDQGNEAMPVQTTNKSISLYEDSRPLKSQSASDIVATQSRLPGAELTKSASNITRQIPMIIQENIETRQEEQVAKEIDRECAATFEQTRQQLSPPPIEHNTTVYKGSNDVRKPHTDAVSKPTDEVQRISIQNKDELTTSNESQRSMERQSNIDVITDDSSSEFTIEYNGDFSNRAVANVQNEKLPLVKDHLKTAHSNDELSEICGSETKTAKAMVNPAKRAAIRAGILEVASVKKQTVTDTVKSDALSGNKQVSHQSPHSVYVHTFVEPITTCAPNQNLKRNSEQIKQEHDENIPVNKEKQYVQSKKTEVQFLSKPAVAPPPKPSMESTSQDTVDNDKPNVLSTPTHTQLKPVELQTFSKHTNEKCREFKSIEEITAPNKQEEQVLPKPRLLSPKSSGASNNTEKQNDHGSKSISPVSPKPTQVAESTHVTPVPIKVRTLSGLNEFSNDLTGHIADKVSLVQSEQDSVTGTAISKRLLEPERQLSTKASLETQTVSEQKSVIKKDEGSIDQPIQKSLSSRRRNRKKNTGGDLPSAIKSRQTDSCIENSADNEQRPANVTMEEL